MPNRSRMRAPTASAHGAWTRRPYGDSSTTRQSPSSSRKRSTTRVRSVGTHAGGLAAARAGTRRGWCLARVSSSPACLAVEIAADELADGGAELVRTSDGVALPERQSCGLAEGGGDDHAVVGDLLDAPAGGAEREDVVDARLVDHLLVELAHPPASGAPACLVDSLGEGDGEHAAVGDGAAAGDRQPLGAGTSGERAGVAVPDEPRPQLGELIGRVTPGQEVESGVERRAGHRRERRTATDERRTTARRRAVRVQPPRPSAGRGRRAGWPARRAAR